MHGESERHIVPQENQEQVTGPIIACVGTFAEYQEQLLEFTEWEKQIGTTNIDYIKSTSTLDAVAYKNNAPGTYIISGIDSSNKFSHGYVNCSGVVAVGIDKETGQNISFMSHQNPTRILDADKDAFVNELCNSLKELTNRIIPGTLDVAIFGGNYLLEDNSEIATKTRLDYLNTILLLQETIAASTNIRPCIFEKPKDSPSTETAYFDTKKRRFYLVRKDNSTKRFEDPREDEAD